MIYTAVSKNCLYFSCESKQEEKNLSYVFGVYRDKETKMLAASFACFDEIYRKFKDFLVFDVPVEQVFQTVKELNQMFGEPDNSIVSLMKLKPYDYQVFGGTAFLPVVKKGILADEVGVGKSCQALVGFTYLHHHGIANKCLLICKKALKSQWLSEIEKFTFFKGIIIKGDQKERAVLYEEAKKPEYHFIITNYEQYQHDDEWVETQSKRGLNSLNDYQELVNLSNLCQVICLDEAQKIKNHTSKTHINIVGGKRKFKNKDTGKTFYKTIPGLEAEYKWCLTGTPIENQPSDIYNILKFVNPTLLGNNPMTFQERYYSGKWHQNVRSNMLSDLKQRVAPAMLRRRQKDVEHNFPDARIDNVLLDMDESQADLHEYIRKTGYDQCKNISDSDQTELTGRDIDESKLTPLTCFTYLIRVADAPYLLKTSPTDLSQQLFQKKYKGRNNKEIESPKLEWIKEFIEERKQTDSNLKTIIFSRSEDFIELIASQIKDIYSEEEVCIYLGKLNDKQRIERVDRFVNGIGKIFISSDSGSEGLNLQVADVLINADLPYNPARLEQRIGRIKRNGSKYSHVRIINLVSKNSIEEKMLNTIYNKQGIIDVVVDGNRLKSRMTKNILKKLLAE